MNDSLDEVEQLAEAFEQTHLDPSLVELVCIKEKGKLRVRIVSPGYLRHANCQFPRDLRVQDRHYKVEARYVHLMTQRGKYFYSVRQRDKIRVYVSNEESQTAKEDDQTLLAKIQLYEDETTQECMVCMDALKSSVFYPCGHYYCCEGCAGRVKKCPICRQTVDRTIHKDLFEA